MVYFRTDKIFEIIKFLNENTNVNSMAEISKKLEITYSHVTKLIGKLEKANIIYTEKEGRKREVTLTTKGHDLSKSCIKLIQFIEESKKIEEK